MRRRNEILPDLIHLPRNAQRLVNVLAWVPCRPLLGGEAVRNALLARNAGISYRPRTVDIDVVETTDIPRVTAALSAIAALTEVPHADRSRSHNRELAAVVDGETYKVTIHTRQPDDRLTVDALRWDPNTCELLDPFNGLADLIAGSRRPAAHVRDAEVA